MDSEHRKEQPSNHEPPRSGDRLSAVESPVSRRHTGRVYVSWGLIRRRAEGFGCGYGRKGASGATGTSGTDPYLTRGSRVAAQAHARLFRLKAKERRSSPRNRKVVLKKGPPIIECTCFESSSVLSEAFLRHERLKNFGMSLSSGGVRGPRHFRLRLRVLHPSQRTADKDGDDYPDLRLEKTGLPSSPLGDD